MVPRAIPSLFSVILSSVVSCGCGALGIVVYEQQKSINRGAGLSLIVGELGSVLALPLWASRRPIMVKGSMLVIALMSLLSAAAGVVLITDASWTSASQGEVEKALVGLYIFGLLISGYSVGSMLETYEQWMSHDSAVRVDRYDDEKQSSKTTESNRVVSMKASAATLVDHFLSTRPSTAQSTVDQAFRLGSISLSTLRNSNSRQKLVQPQDYSIKKLSVINQSQSSTELSGVENKNLPRGLSNNSLGSQLATFLPPPSEPSEGDNKASDLDLNNDGVIMRERDAINRIPSVLLPPHLRPTNDGGLNDKICPQLNSTNQLIHAAQSQHGDAMMYNEPVIQTIPRAMSLDALTNPEHTGELRTISLEDYEKNRMDPYMSTNVFQSAPQLSQIRQTCANLQTIVTDDELVDLEQTATDEAMKLIEDARKADEEELRSCINQTSSDLNLKRLKTPTTANTSKSSSPHKSIFGHSRMSSSISFKAFTTSMNASPHGSTSSPRKRTSQRNSPKKLGSLKNLSLSNIVYKTDNDCDYDDDHTSVPEFPYVHELQSSPTRRKSVLTLGTPRRGSIQTLSTMKAHNEPLQPHSSSIPQTPLKGSRDEPAILSERTNTSTGTHNSPGSCSSTQSVFPHEVIGEYDKEKWKTMVRLNMVSDQNEGS